MRVAGSDYEPGLDAEMLAGRQDGLLRCIEVSDDLFSDDHRHAVEANDVAQLLDLALEVQKSGDVRQVAATALVACLWEPLQVRGGVRNENGLAELGDPTDRHSRHGPGDDDHVNGPIRETLFYSSVCAFERPVRRRLGLYEDNRRVFLHELEDLSLEERLPLGELLRLPVGDDHDAEGRLRPLRLRARAANERHQNREDQQRAQPDCSHEHLARGVPVPEAGA